MIERRTDECLEVYKITFGTEPKEQEIITWFLENYQDIHYIPAIESPFQDTIRNPKRRQREIQKKMSATIGTKSQQALTLQYEQKLTSKKTEKRMKKQEQKIQQWQMKQKKRKEKHRGR